MIADTKTANGPQAFAKRADDKIDTIFHTGLLSQAKLEGLLAQLAAGTLSHDELFAGHGHGALVLDADPAGIHFVAVTGPRRGLLAGSKLRPYLAVPHGDMMMSGCWGLVRACAQLLPWAAGAIEAALDSPPH